MKAFRLDIISPEKSLYQGEAERVSLPGTMGAFTILPGHAPIISSLQAGKLSYLSGGQEHVVEIRGGFVEMSDGRVAACVEV